MTWEEYRAETAPPIDWDRVDADGGRSAWRPRTAQAAGPAPDEYRRMQKLLDTDGRPVRR